MEPPNLRKPSKTKLPAESGKRRTWTKEEEAALINGLKELMTTGWKCENGFKTGYLCVLEKSLAKAFPGAGLRADPHINNKIHVWKKNYGSLCELIRTSGFGWNDEAKMVSVDSEDVWKEYIKANPSAEKLRCKIWPYFDHWCEIFGKDKATGETSEDFITSDKDQLDDGVGSEGNKDTSEHGEENDSLSARQPSSSSTGKKSVSKRKRQIDSTGEKLVELMEAFCEQNKALFSEFTKNIGVEYDLQTQRKAVYEALGGIGELSVATKVRLSKLLVNNSQELDLFFSLPKEAKMEMVHQMLDDI